LTDYFFKHRALRRSLSSFFGAALDKSIPLEWLAVEHLQRTRPALEAMLRFIVWLAPAAEKSLRLTIG
jgi:hypothetical protein